MSEVARLVFSLEGAMASREPIGWLQIAMEMSTSILC